VRGFDSSWEQADFSRCTFLLCTSFRGLGPLPLPGAPTTCFRGSSLGNSDTLRCGRPLYRRFWVAGSAPVLSGESVTILCHGNTHSSQMVFHVTVSIGSPLAQVNTASESILKPPKECSFPYVLLALRGRQSPLNAERSLHLLILQLLYPFFLLHKGHMQRAQNFA
jgi:hypothetical protein